MKTELQKGVDTVMEERRKTGYEGARLEILAIRAEDVISTSDQWADHYDKNSWITPGAKDDKWD